MYSYWQLKLACLSALNLASITLSVVAIYFYISTKNYKKTSHISSFNLLLVCLLQSVTTLPLYGARYWGCDQEGVRDAFLFMYFLTQNVITFSLLAMSLDRVASLWKPLLYTSIITKRRTVKSLIACWVICIGYDVIPFFNGYSKKNITLYYIPEGYWSVVYHFLTNIVAFIMLLLCWIYIIHIAIYHHRKFHTQQADKANKNPNIVIKLKATKLTITIITSYLVLYGPACFYYSMKAICLDQCFPENYNNSKVDIELRFIWKFQALLFTPISILILCYKKRFFIFLKTKLCFCRQSREVGNFNRSTTVVKSTNK